MDIKKCLKKKIISTVLSSIADSEWSVLIYDKTCAGILKNLFTKSEFITYNIVMSQLIDEVREQIDFPVIYFVDCSQDIAEIINQDFKNKKYSYYMVCSLNIPQNLDAEIEWKQVNLNFTSLEDKVFISSVSNLYSIADTLGSYFYMEVATNKLREEISNLEIMFKEKNRSGKLIIFDRTIDMYTPLVNFFTFQAMLENYNLTDMSKIYEEYSSTKLWKDVRDVHIGEISEVLRSYVTSITSSKNQTGKKVNTKDLMKMVMDAPEKLKTNEMLKLFFKLSEKCYEKFEYLNIFNNLEQSIITGIDKNKKKADIKFKDVLKCIANKNICKSDKLKVLFLLKFSKYEFKYEDIERLKKYLTNEEIEKILSFDNSDFNPLKYDYKYEYEVSRYEPTISVALREYLKKGKNLIGFKKLEQERSTVKSLRKSNLISIKKEVESDKIYCVYIIGGVTYQEVSCIRKLSEELGVEFIIGSDKLIKGDEFFNELMK